jgi:hypothetical protein
MIYLICFASSCLLIWLGENSRKYFITSKAIFLLALAIPAALAGLRDFTIGVDVLFYGNPFFYDVVSSPNLNAVSPQWDGWIEPGYRWLNFIVAQFTDNVRWFYFWIMLLQNAFAFLGFYAYRSKMPIWLGMLCYYFFFFNYSLNAIRECLALSIIFFASSYLLKKSYIKFAVWILIALFFHKSALIAFSLIPLHIYVSKFGSDRAKFILIVGSVIFFISLETIVEFILGAMQMDYLMMGLRYLSGETEYTWRTHAILFIVFFPPAAFFYFKRKEMYDIGKEYHFFLIITVICLLAAQLIYFGPFTARIGMVFRWFLALALPMSLAVYKDLPGKRILLKLSIVCYAAYYWFFVLIHRNRDETFPYYSPILSSVF